MKKDWELTPETFERLLNWLDSDREVAGEKYEKIQLRLVKVFSCHGCADPDRLADTTIDRVSAKIDWLIENYVGDPALFFCGVARNIIKEDLRDRAKIADLRDVGGVSPENDVEQDYECLDRCLAGLSPRARQLVLDYYEAKGQIKIVNRRKLAEELGITLRALRLRVYHLRLQLRSCIETCLEQGAIN